MNRIPIVFLFFISYFIVYQSNAQINYINGTISTTTTASVNNISVTIEYYDSASVDTTTMVSTNSSGYYSDTTQTGVFDSVRVIIPSCTSSVQLLSKTSVIIGFMATIDFTNFCFSASFTHYESNDTVSFNASAVGGVGNPSSYNYHFDFGDGADTSLQFPKHVYNTSGYYIVKLTVTDSLNDVAEAVDSIPTQLAIPFFSYVRNGLQVSFTNNSTALDPNPGYFWDFGDSQSSFQTNPVHTYNTFGFYTVCLTITDSVMPGIKTVCQVISLTGAQNCQAQFTTQKFKTIVEFRDQSFFNPPVSSYNLSWDFGDSSVAIVNDTSPVHVYPDTGFYKVIMTISDSSCTDTAAKLVRLSGAGFDKLILSGELSFNNNPRNGFVELIGGSQPSGLNVIDTMSSFKNHYVFFVDKDKTYYVRANPHSSDPQYENIFPTYYPNHLLWSDATGVLVSNSSVMEHNIELLGPTTSTGTATVSGKVVYSSTQSGAPGINIYAYDLLFNPMKKTTTDGNGNYQLNNLGTGMTYISPEIPGKTSFSKDLNIQGSSSNFAGINFTIHDDKIVGISNTKGIETDLKVYPNPVSDLLHIQVNGTATIELMDPLGRRLMYREKPSSAYDLMKLNLHEAPVGNLILKVVTEDEVKLINILKINN